MLASLAPPEEREAYLAFLRDTQRPQGWAALEQPWPGQSLPDVPRTYVLCTEDNIIPPAKQREMAARLGVEPLEIASDHAAFTYHPRELAAVLAALPLVTAASTMGMRFSSKASPRSSAQRQ